mgnify:FL=1
MEFKTELLKRFVDVLKQNGFKVYATINDRITDKITYVHFEINNNIGYVQDNYFGGLDFSSVHKPNQENGTGFQIHKEITEPTIKHATDCFILKPHWARNGEVKKYKSFEEYKTSPIGSILKYFEV